MTDHDRAATRREITGALLAALDRRHEVLDVIVDAPDRSSAVASISRLLQVSALGAEAVMGMSFEKLTIDARRANQAELDDLDRQLTFTLAQRPASIDDALVLRVFDGAVDDDIFRARTESVGSAGDGSGAPASVLDDELSKAADRVRMEEAAWYVALDGTTKVGMVFGELTDGEVNVRVWIHPDHRKRGFGTAALRKSRIEMASTFPGVPMIVRAPGAHV